MTDRLLTCPRCGHQAGVAEDITGFIDWGPAVIGDDGAVRPAAPGHHPAPVLADNSTTVGRPRACCLNRACGHQWRLRRRFEAITRLAP